MPIVTQTSPGNLRNGVLLVIAATLTFALADVTTKHLTERFNVPLVVALRYGVNLACLLVFLLPRHGRAAFVTQRTGLVWARGACLALASLTMGLALQRMPVGEALAIVYLGPLVVLILALPILHEKVPLAGWIGAGVGFLGVLLIARPGSGLAPAGVLFALINAVVSAFYHLFSRLLARTETTMALLIYTAAAGTVLFGAMLPWYWDWQDPTLLDISLMLALGVLTTLGHALFTAAYREAPASLLAPVNYLHLVWATGLGWLVFAHVPDAITLAGMALVAGAGIAVALRRG